LQGKEGSRARVDGTGSRLSYRVLGNALDHLIKEGGDVDMDIVLPYRKKKRRKRDWEVGFGGARWAK
jgi:hypothetical protein